MDPQLVVAEVPLVLENPGQTVLASTEPVEHYRPSQETEQDMDTSDIESPGKFQDINST